MMLTEHNSKRDVLRRVRVACVLLSLSLSAACAQDPQKEIRQEAQTLSSWAATLRLVGDSWREGSVPTPYAKKAIEAARATLRDELKTIQGSSTIPADARAALSERARSLDALGDAMSRAVQGEDRAATEQLAGSLTQEQQLLGSLAQKVDAQPR
jgi:hypothetical protein